MEYNGRTRQHIAAARAGIHSTLGGDVEVSHVGDRTICKAYKPSGVHLIPHALTGEGHEGDRQFLSLAERQRRAMHEFAPRPFPHASTLSGDDVIWRNGVGFPRWFAKEMVDASLAAGLSVPAEIASAVDRPVDTGSSE